MITRRKLLGSSIAAVGVGALSPSWLPAAVHAQEQSGQDPIAATHPDGRILVVVQMSGGNDGLNTVVPYADDAYQKARPTLRIAQDKVLALDDHIGLHPSLKALRKRYDDGQVAVLQGVGYPQPNRSHFRSMDIWHTADPDGPPRNGWLGRFADARDPTGSSPALLVQLGSSVSLAMRRSRTAIIALDNEDSFSLGADSRHTGDRQAQVTAFRKLCECGTHAANVGRYSDFLHEQAASSLASADEVLACLGQGKSQVTYPRNLGPRLALVARMIAGGMKTRAYYTSIGGFDTHAKQADGHANLLTNFSESIDAFFKDLEQLGRARDVLLVSFSEFGRRVAENASAGTDHGTAGPMFVVGPSVKGGLQGSAPDLEHLVDGDPQFGIDFRSVYAALLGDWLKAPVSSVIEAEVPRLDLVATV
jgi:uncharacterized protein (DUF1501 family)